MTVKECAELLGRDVNSLRIALQMDRVPFGVAFKKAGNKKYTYFIYPEKVNEYLGKKKG